MMDTTNTFLTQEFCQAILQGKQVSQLHLSALNELLQHHSIILVNF